jgi:hypothetical protein
MPRLPARCHRRRTKAGLAGLTALVAALVISPPMTALAAPRGRIAAPPTMVASAPAHDRTTLLYEVYDPRGSETLFLATHALTPTVPIEIARIDHAEGYPPQARASSDGARIAMTRLPPGARRDSPAELVLIDPTSHARRTVATDAHYFMAPIVTKTAVFYLRQSLAAEPSAEEQRQGVARQVHVALVRYDLAAANSRVLFEATLVDLALLGAARDGGEIIALKRTLADAEVVAIDPVTGTHRTIVRQRAGRDLLRASLDMDERFVLLTEVATGASDAELRRVSTRGGAVEPIQLTSANAPPALLADGLLVRASGAELTLSRAGVSRTLRGPRPDAKDAALVGLSPDGRFTVARWLVGPSQVYQVVDANTGSMAPLPPPSGGDLFGMNAEVVGFVQPARSSVLGGAR